MPTDPHPKMSYHEGETETEDMNACMAPADEAEELISPNEDASATEDMGDNAHDEAFATPDEAANDIAVTDGSAEKLAKLPADEPDDAMRESSLHDRLQDLADALADGKSPLLAQHQVMIERAPALELVETLLSYCEEDDLFLDDGLIDRLASDKYAGDASHMPLKRVKQRARVIIGDATVQAEHILDDAHTLAARLLQDTENKIQERCDEVEKEINERISTTNEVSTKRLNESRDELITSRKKAVDILNRYMDKAEEDYQGYWERAEKSLLVSLQKSDTAYAKVAETFERELESIREDMKVLTSILEDLKLNRPR